MKILEGMQKLGRSLMLPIAVLPVAALMLRLGAGDLLDIPFVFEAGNAIFSNLPLIFAIGVAVGLSKDNAGAAALAGAIGYLVFTAAIHSLNQDVDMGVLSGIMMGISAGMLYNRFYNIKLVEWLAFFGGRRFVPIATSGLALVLAFFFNFAWPPVQGGIDAVANWIIGSGAVGTFVYGTMNRLLIPTGLHHILNNLVWFTFGDFTNAAGAVIHGDLHRFFAGDSSAGSFMAGFFPIMMFGLPAAALAIFQSARPERRAAVGGILFSVAFTAFLTGVTEPIEYMFMFVAPALYAIHAVLTGISMAICSVFDIKLGFGFSAGAIDYVLNYGLATRPLYGLALGGVFFFVYYFLFLFAIRVFDLQTPGRDEAASTVPDVRTDDDLAGLATACMKDLGGSGNLTTIDSCITRLRLEVKDPSLVNEEGLKQHGAKGVVRVGETGVQVILGTQAELVAIAMSAIKKEETVEPDAEMLQLFSPLEGELIPIEETPDVVFAEKTVGDGVAIIPSGDTIYAPANGMIGKIFDTNHAFSMETDDGIELFVHFGVDTVELKGEGFTRIAEPGSEVKKGDPIIKYDLALLEKIAKSVITPVVISNTEEFGEMTKASGKVASGDPILSIRKKS